MPITPMPGGAECGICHDGPGVGAEGALFELGCGHGGPDSPLHLGCLNTWAEQADGEPTCPLCRRGFQADAEAIVLIRLHAALGDHDEEPLTQENADELNNWVAQPAQEADVEQAVDAEQAAAAVEEEEREEEEERDEDEREREEHEHNH